MPDGSYEVINPHGAVARGSVHDALQGQQGTFTGIRDRSGSMQSMAQITEDSIVGIPGVGEMSLASALAAGYAHPDGRGGYTTDPNAAGAPAQAPAPQVDPLGQQGDQENQDEDQDAEDYIHPDHLEPRDDGRPARQFSVRPAAVR